MRGSKLEVYAGRLEELGVMTFLQELPDPVLVRIGELSPSSSTTPSFQTQGMKRMRWPFRSRTPFSGARAIRGIDQLANEGDVWEVTKRAEGAFRGRISVGRVDTADITIALSAVSKLHAYFEHDSQGWYIVDVDSTNGTFVDGIQLEPRLRCFLHDGAKIEIGPFAFRFLSPESFADELASTRAAPTSSQSRPIP